MITPILLATLLAQAGDKPGEPQPEPSAPSPGRLGQALYGNQDFESPVEEAVQTGKLEFVPARWPKSRRAAPPAAGHPSAVGGAPPGTTRAPAATPKSKPPATRTLLRSKSPSPIS